MSHSTSTVSPLRQRMIEDMVMRKLSPKTQSSYLRHVSALGEYLGRSKKPDFPEKTANQSTQIAGFCQTNPHRFATSFESLPWPSKIPQCYTHKEDGIILEIPDELFCEGWSGRSLDSIIRGYVLQLAMYHKSGFELVLYNKSHWVYRQLVIDQNHALFKYLHDSEIVAKRMSFIVEKISASEYAKEIIGCAIHDKTLDGKECPVEIGSKAAAVRTNAWDYKNSLHWPHIKHDEYK